MYSIGILTVSDKGSRGEREDKTGPAVQEVLEKEGYVVKQYCVVPDEIQIIKEKLIYMSDELKLNVILTNGGTGFSIRDVTPEATKEVIQREVPGFGEAMRMKSLEITPHAMLSRAIAGIRNKSLIINLPGSPKGAVENLQTILPALEHGIEILIGKANECAKRGSA
ncbi:molybdopterin adenylyltransferase [Bacillota bacterium LX-D]|nr:molybdopterin adenylyltransferase [Bacillota bacterium LX-D]